MHDWLEVLPVWFVEGIAEYMAAVPFDDARFDFRRMNEGLLGYLETAYQVNRGSGPKKAVPLDMVVPEDLMALTHQQWASALSNPQSASLNYRSALLLVYYLIHLDGKGDGSSIVAYLRQAWTKQGRCSISSGNSTKPSTVTTPPWPPTMTRFVATTRNWSISGRTWNRTTRRFGSSTISSSTGWQRVS